MFEVALGGRRVVVATDPDVRGAEVLDRVEERVLGRRAVVHRVAGVDDDRDVVLLDEEEMIFQLAGFRWMSETCRTRIVDGSGRYAGSVDVTS